MASTDLERGRYDPKTIETGLIAIVGAGGNCQLAHERLREAGVEVPRSTLQHWKKHGHPERYQQLQDQYAPILEQEIVRGERERLLALGALEAKAIQAVDDNFELLEPKEQAQALKNISTSKGIAVDKLLTLTNRPTVIHSTQSADDLEAEIHKIKLELLEEFGINPAQITDAEIVD